MVESKVFSSDAREAESPPLVPVSAGEPIDVWHLEAVPVPTAPSFLYDESPHNPVLPREGRHSSGEIAVPSSVIIGENVGESSVLSDSRGVNGTCENAVVHLGRNENVDDLEDEDRLSVGAGVASGVVGL